MAHTTEVFFISPVMLSIEISAKGKMKNSGFRVLTKVFILGFVFVFETDLLETTYLINGWHTLRVIRYKIKFQHTKKVKNALDRNYHCFKKSLHTTCIFLLDQELSSPLTKTKEKPDG